MLAALTSRQVRAIGAASILIGLVFAAEGTLLATRIWWATYFTIVLTALGIPPEIVEIAKRPGSARRYLLLAVNVAILVYLWSAPQRVQDVGALVALTLRIREPLRQPRLDLLGVVAERTGLALVDDRPDSSTM